MPFHFVTAEKAENHIRSGDFGSYNIATFGSGCHILRGCEAEIVDSNTIRILDGDLLIDGRHARIVGFCDLEIRSGEVGRNRNDVIAIRYSKDKDGFEDGAPVVLPGTPTDGQATDPAFTSGSIEDGDVLVERPLYRVPIAGLAVGQPVCLMKRSAPFIGHGHKAADVSGAFASALGGLADVTPAALYNVAPGAYTVQPTAAGSPCPGQYGNIVVSRNGGDRTWAVVAFDEGGCYILRGWTKGGHAATWDRIDGGGLAAYPVGAVYISYVSTSPASLFGGTWAQMTGVFPYFGTGTATGGSNTHTLSAAQMPSHSHSVGANAAWSAGGNGSGATVGPASGTWTTMSVGSAGGGQAHNNMPAYQTLYAWRRTA